MSAILDLELQIEELLTLINTSDISDCYTSYCKYSIEDIYEEVLDEVYDSITFAGMTIYASEMRSMDPIMFREGVCDYIDGNFQEVDGEYYIKEDFNTYTNELYGLGCELELLQDELYELLETQELTI